MDNCPKCGRKLKLTDWKPNCPGCGVNIVYYGREEMLDLEADKAEEDHAKLQKKIDRLKAAFIGSPLSIIRIFLSLLPIGALMLPLCTLTYSGPLIEQTTAKVNVITIYNLVSNLDFGAVTTFMSSKLLNSSATAYLVGIVAVLVSLVFVIIALFALIAACGPKGNIRNITNNSISIIGAATGIVAFSIFSKSIHGVFPEFISGTLSIGALIYLLSLVLLLAINIVIAVKKIPVKYKKVLIGGLDSEYYYELKNNGTDIKEIHAMMDEALNKIAEEKEAKKEHDKAKEAKADEGK
ncbi:MAG: hypothetical protein K6B52_03625 [Clostridiales bacterium]|nr:hypothetical protein [Clostridiales bacterium]